METRGRLALPLAEGEDLEAEDDAAAVEADTEPAWTRYAAARASHSEVGMDS